MTEEPFNPEDTMLDDAPQVDYFGFSKDTKFWFPDHKTYLILQAMNEGAKKKFQKLTQRDLVLERTSGNARMRVDAATERHEMIRESVKEWNLVRGDTPVPLNERNMKDFLELADPTLIEEIEKAIRKLNPWMLAEMTVEDIDREIANLQDMRKVAEERERGEAG
jgi:hypothetical protein